jgi:acetyl-CoA hydrolase
LDFVHQRPPLRLAPPSYTHALCTLAAQPQFVALTGALEVDLTGQINAETAQGRYVGAVGGQLSLLRGARADRTRGGTRGGLPGE